MTLIINTRFHMVRDYTLAQRATNWIGRIIFTLIFVGIVVMEAKLNHMF